MAQDPIAEALRTAQGQRAAQDPIAEALRTAQGQGAPRGVLSALQQGRTIGVRDVGATAGRALEAVSEAPGVRQLFHALRVPQQAAVLGQ